MKYVIARNEGPITKEYVPNNSKLVKGHKYEVLFISYPGDQVKHPMPDINPREPKFYIRVKDDTDTNAWSMWFTGEHDYWNDYFLSTEEMRELNLNEILDEK